MYSENDFRYYSEDELAHYGIMGQKWGVRNYQNPDGSLTPEGKIRYGSNSSESFYKRQSRIRKGVQDQEKVQRMENRGKTDSNRYRKYKDLADTRLADASEAEIKLAKNMIQDYRNHSVAYLIAGVPGAITYDIVESMLPSGRERRELTTQAHREYNARRSQNQQGDQNNETPNRQPQNRQQTNQSNRSNQGNGDNKSRYMANARKNDTYDIEFLETIQNKSMNKSQKLAEYDKYLDDPNDYITNADKRLRKYRDEY